MNDEPRMSAEEMIGRLPLSPWARIRAVVALTAGLAGAVFVGALWISEPGPLPGGTRLAFALFMVFCLAWACFEGWLMTRGAPLFATDRVIAAWLALTASAVMTVVVTTVAVQRGTGLVLPLATGAVLIAVTAVLAVRAPARRAALLRRKRELSGG
jgi:hypothetical protein